MMPLHQMGLVHSRRCQDHSKPLVAQMTPPWACRCDEQLRIQLCCHLCRRMYSISAGMDRRGQRVVHSVEERPKALEIPGSHQSFCQHNLWAEDSYHVLSTQNPE